MPIVKETKSDSWTSQIAIEKARELSRDAELEWAKTSRDGLIEEEEYREALLEELLEADEVVGANLTTNSKVVTEQRIYIDPISVDTTRIFGLGLRNGVGRNSGGYKSCFIDLETRTLHAAGEAGPATRGYLRGFFDALADNYGLTLDIRIHEND